MKTTALFSALLLALAATASFSASAATADGKPLASEAQAAKPAAKKVKPHSHVEEKMGISLAAKSAEKNDQAAPQKRDKSKHFHPTDGK
ncbi:MAG TPA: hypothetical protein VFH22_10130 [Rhodocyclaceae bacterium]|nr:hypothetical protein [Rhodocyclaceae bacterium]